MITGKKVKTAYFCTHCGAEHAKWQGQCRECGQWNCLVEEKIVTSKTKATTLEIVDKKILSEISFSSHIGYKSGISEFDRVIGGQLLPGMTILLGGEPGIGKSTLVLQVAEAFSRQDRTIIYITGEESLTQLKLRSQRLHVTGNNIIAVNATSLAEINGLLATENFDVVIIDSIQTISSDQYDSPPGTVAQIRESAYQLIGQAKAKGFALILIGHVTKDGMVAGPKLLEHMVDTVIYFEGDQTHLYRLLRATKNRFGSVAEIGLFEMKTEGLVEVANPSSFFLAGYHQDLRSGSVVTAICEGTRPILVEVQALVTSANYGTPQRVAGGLDNKRLALLLAILEKRCGYPMISNDVFVSIAGGLKLSEPSLDLPLLVAIVSSLLNKPLDNKTVVVGEVGLSGEVRGVTMMEKRINEAFKLGFKKMILPYSNLSQCAHSSMELIGVKNIQSALDLFN
ncbi:MAG: DNA repair protein RadA [FCB group bacterium]|nr:DNA repair protein RadA [FCB group bacterium]